ncbi:MAG: radical SAM protein [Candidatus Omnitrophica bacterium]|nr:radical SAM protein [Candidatus Omnitrophota bacterium]
MKILLTNPPWKRGGHWGVRAGSRWPHIKTPQEKCYLPFPFFLAYAAALLKREGYTVRLIDALALEMPPGEFLRVVEKESPDLLVAETSTPSLENDLALLRGLPQGLPVALCGPETHIQDPRFLEKHPRVRYVFKGEYEYTLLELVRRLESGQDLSGLRGLTYLESGQYKENPPRPLLENLDDLPWPLREGLPMGRYNDAPGGIPGPSVQMWSSRGCPYQCLFCVWPQLMYQSHRYRGRTIAKVVDEMEYLVKILKFRSVYFDDDTTNIGKLRMMELAREIRRRDLNVPWAMMARADLMDEDILEHLRGAGLAAVKYGVESAEQRLVDNIAKNMDLRKAERMVRFTQSLGIKTHLTFSFGLPGETQETIQRTIDFAIDLDPDTLQFSINTAFPGTRYYEELDRRAQIVSRNLADYDGNSKAMLRTEALSAKDLQKARRRAEAVWREHLWHTRHLEAGPDQYFSKFIRSVRSYGPVATLLKVFSFVRYKAKELGPRVHPRQLLPANLKHHFFLGRAKVLDIIGKMKKRWLNALGIYHGVQAFKGPDCVQIDLTSNCNNNCIGCWCNSPLLEERAYKGAKKHKTLPTQLVFSLLDELAGMGTKELYFSGGGEPFMHPDILPILAHAKGLSLECCVNTNFTLVNEKVVKQLVDMGVDGLTVSVWAATPQTYALTHPNKDEATFYRIKDTLKMLNALKKDGRPLVKIYNVISNLNYREVEAMVAFAEETGSEAVEFTVVDTIPGATDKLLLDPDQRREVLVQCERIMKGNLSVKVLNLEHFTRRLVDAGADEAQYDSGFLGSSCHIGWVFSRIMPDGDVNFCLKAHRIPVGNLYESSFHEIWNASKQKEYRRKALKFDVTDEFFRQIGNDADCRMGCYKSCDDIGRNRQVQRQLDALSFPEKALLKLTAGLKRGMRKK